MKNARLISVTVLLPASKRSEKILKKLASKGAVISKPEPMKPHYGFDGWVWNPSPVVVS